MAREAFPYLSFSENYAFSCLRTHPIRHPRANYLRLQQLMVVVVAQCHIARRHIVGETVLNCVQETVRWIRLNQSAKLREMN